MGDKGITLVALVITIIILLILVGITLNLTIRTKRNYHKGSGKQERHKR